MSKVYETKMRSILKATSFRIIEIAIDAFILSFFVETHIAIGLSVALETTCLILHYTFERVWNTISYGRDVV